MKKTKQQIGKSNRASGARFELKVRKNLESKGWIVDKWSNNVEFSRIVISKDESNNEEKIDISKPYRVIVGTSGNLVKVKNKFLGPGKPMMLGAGFPDFISYRKISISHHSTLPDGVKNPMIDYEVIGVEAKSNGYLDKIEKAKCKWLLENNIFSKILCAQKGKKRGEIIYKEVAV